MFGNTFTAIIAAFFVAFYTFPVEGKIVLDFDSFTQGGENVQTDAVEDQDRLNAAFPELGEFVFPQEEIDQVQLVAEDSSETFHPQADFFFDQSAGFEVEEAEAETTEPVLSRSKRGISDSLREIFKKAYRTPALEGEVLFMAKKICEAKFNIERGTYKRSEILSAELHLFKVAPKKLKFKQRPGKTPLLQARVSIHQVIKRRKNLPSTTRLLDSSLVQVEQSGWMKFDISKAFKDWVRSNRKNKGIEVWVESVEAGKVSARVARKVKFIKPDSNKTQKRPALVVYFKNKTPKGQS